MGRTYANDVVVDVLLEVHGVCDCQGAITDEGVRSGDAVAMSNSSKMAMGVEVGGLD
jgi:hypothetical protein